MSECSRFIFAFTKTKEEELIISDKLKNILQRTRESLGGNYDQLDPEFISLKEELKRLFDSKKLNDITKEEMDLVIQTIAEFYQLKT